MTHRVSISVLLYLAMATATSAQSPASHARTGSGINRSTAPAVPASIRPTTMGPDNSSIEVASDHWSARGYDLKSLLAEVYAIDPRRIDIPDTAVTTARYDVSFTLSDEASPEDIQHIVQQALHEKFGINITPETRPLDVYVITSPNGPGPALHPHVARATGDEEGIEHFAYKAQVCPGISSGGISASAGSIGEFRRTLEPTLDRLILNESNLPGSYDFQIGEYRSKDELFQLLRKQLGLVLAPSHRNVVVLAVRPTQGLDAKLVGEQRP